MTKYVALRSRNFGEFAVLSLRNVARTALYMHNGSLATLADVVAHQFGIGRRALARQRRAVVARATFERAGEVTN